MRCCRCGTSVPSMANTDLYPVGATTWKRRTDFRVFKKSGGVILALACYAERPLSSSFTCDTLDRASPDPERLGHLQDANTLRKLLSHLTFSRAV
jgi:hypothetical protein